MGSAEYVDGLSADRKNILEARRRELIELAHDSPERMLYLGELLCVNDTTESGRVASMEAVITLVQDGLVRMLPQQHLYIGTLALTDSGIEAAVAQQVQSS